MEGRGRRGKREGQYWWEGGADSARETQWICLQIQQLIGIVILVNNKLL